MNARRVRAVGLTLMGVGLVAALWFLALTDVVDRARGTDGWISYSPLGPTPGDFDLDGPGMSWLTVDEQLGVLCLLVVAVGAVLTFLATRSQRAARP